MARSNDNRIPQFSAILTDEILTPPVDHGAVFGIDPAQVASPETVAQWQSAASNMPMTYDDIRERAMDHGRRAREEQAHREHVREQEMRYRGNFRGSSGIAAQQEEYNRLYQAVQQGQEQMAQSQLNVQVDWERWQGANQVESHVSANWPITPEETDEECMARLQIKTMRDARGKHYEVFPGPDNKERGEKEAALKYIDALGAQNGVDVSDWKISSFKKGGEMIVKRSDLNKIFFTLSKKAKKAIAPKYVRAAVIKDLSARLEYNIQHDIQDTDVNILNQQTWIKSHQEDLENKKRNILKGERALLELCKKRGELVEKSKNTTGKYRFSKQLKDLLRTGKFMLPEKQPDRRLHLLTKPIYKSFFRKEQAKALMVPLGQYLIELTRNGNSWTTKVLMGKNNIVCSDRYYHPHVNHNGSVCMGDMTVPYTEAVNKGNFFEAMICIYDILANFNEDGSPYVEFSNFEIKYKQNLSTQKRNKKMASSADVPF